MHHHWIILLGAFSLDALLGYPRWLYARIGHPVVWMGVSIAFLEKNFNHSRMAAPLRRVLGVAAMILLLMLTLAASWLIHQCGMITEMLCIAALLASRSLYDHVRDIYSAKDIETAREKLSRIVGRDVAALDAAGICRAAIESLAESFCDGVVAPLFWAACFGLPGIACYKMINTADSMIGHKDERYLAFGWAAARIDDAANLIPSRLSGIVIALVSHSQNAWRIMWRDAKKHASPNAGWPEAAMAGALKLRLGGTNMYDGVEHVGAQFGDGTPEATHTHLHQALRIYVAACAVLWLMVSLAWLATAMFP